jgi:hypothetical protein
MRRAVLASLFVLFTMSLAFGQAVVTTGWFATQYGPGVPVAPAWPPLITTPSVQLSTALPSPVGITNEGRAGISIEGRELAVDPQPLSFTVPVVRQPGAVLLPQAALSAPETEEPSAEQNAGTRAIDLGAGEARLMTRRGMQAGPLGSVVHLKTQPAQPAVRTYTNDDMRRLESDAQTHISIVGRK